MKKYFANTTVIAIIFAMVTSGAVGAIPESAINAVTMNCASVSGQLKNVRYYDRRAREYLGNRYEKLIASYVVNLNVRLVKNNMANMKLQELQVVLTTAHNDFKNEYGQYATEMDALIDMSCTSTPEGFYAQLEKVRAQRAAVRSKLEQINSKLVEYRDTVTGIREGL